MKARMFGIFAMAVLVAAIGLEVQAKGSVAKKQIEGVVNLNEASVAQLTMLRGVGQKRAQAIREYVQAHPFKTIEELKAIRGIGDKQLAKLKPYLTLTGPTTAKWVKGPATDQAALPAPTLAN